MKEKKDNPQRIQFVIVVVHNGLKRTMDQRKNVNKAIKKNNLEGMEQGASTCLFLVVPLNGHVYNAVK